MFPTYDQTRALVDDRQSRLTAAARKRRLVTLARRGDETPIPGSQDRAITPVEAVSSAPESISLGRTPSEIDRVA